MSGQQDPNSVMLVGHEEIERFVREHPDARMVLFSSGDEVVTVPLEPHAEDPRPQSVEEWIDQVNQAQLGEPDNDSPLPPGWWILPGLMLGALLWVGVFFAGRATAPEPTVESHQGAQVCLGERD